MSATDPMAANADQIDYWNAAAGETWTAFQAQLDRQLQPLGAEAMRVLAPTPGERILDIGCGCGETSLRLAATVGPEGSVLGVDISAPMLAVARARAAATTGPAPDFRRADAQTGDLGHGVFDAAFSRFGVMFFADPVAAFANIRGSLKPQGRLAFVCWRPLALNAWMLAPLEAARLLLPPLPPPDPTAPGPFAFADADRLRAILSAAGFQDVRIAPFDARIGGGDLDETVTLVQRVGPLGAVLRENPDLAPKVAGVVREALSAYVTEAGVMMPAAAWIVSATNG